MLELVYYYYINYWVNIVITIYPQCLVSIKTCSAISSTENKSSVGMTQLEVYREILIVELRRMEWTCVKCSNELVDRMRVVLRDIR